MLQLNADRIDEMTIPEVTKFIFRYLKIAHGISVQSFINDQFQRIQIDSAQKDRFLRKYQESIEVLYRRGLIIHEYGKLYGHHFILSSIGEKSDLHEDILILIDDAQEIINSIKEKIPNLDPVVEQYYLESLRACQEGLYISSVICLGAASERAIHCLAEAIINYDSNYRTGIENQQYISSLIRYLSRNIDQIFGSITDGAFRSELKDKLEGIGRIYRLNRNEAGHPDKIPQDWQRDEQECYLNQFRRYIMTIFQAIDFLST